MPVPLCPRHAFGEIELLTLPIAQLFRRSPRNRDGLVFPFRVRVVSIRYIVDEGEREVRLARACRRWHIGQNLFNLFG